jgi:DNA primase
LQPWVQPDQRSSTVNQTSNRCIIICYDGDQAGLKATDQAMTILEKAKLKVNVLNS